MENTPVFATSCVATSERLSMTFEHTDLFNSHDVASASARAPFVMGRAAVAAAAVFMGAIARKGKRCAGAKVRVQKAAVLRM